MESLIVGLVISLVTGLAYLAYQHPKSFPKIERPIRQLTLFVFAALNIFQLALTIGRGWISDELFASKTLNSEQKLLISTVVTDASRKHDLPILEISIIYFLIVIYMGILLKLPSILDLESKD